MLRHDAGILHITLQRAEKMNAMTAQMYLAVAQALEAANNDDTVACALIDAEGAHFSAGNDIKEFLDGSYSLAQGSPWRRFAQALPAFKKPLVAGVQGNAVGIGFTMLLHCDFVVADRTARFSAPFARLGLVPEVGSSGLLPARIGVLKANEVFMLGRKILAEEACRLGLVNPLVDTGHAQAQSLSIAREIAALPQHSVAAIKDLSRVQWQMLPEVIEAEAKYFMACLENPETQAILAQFGVKKAS